MTPSPQEVTQWLIAWSNGDQKAFERLVPLVYEELRGGQTPYGRERSGHTLQTTALVNEAYLRLIDASRVQWQNRAHFFAISSQLMRRILVDYARTHNYVKRGGEATRVVLEEAAVIAAGQSPDLVASMTRCRDWRPLTRAKVVWWSCASLAV